MLRYGSRLSVTHSSSHSWLYPLGKRQGKTMKLNHPGASSHLSHLRSPHGQYKRLQYTPVQCFPQVRKTGADGSGAALIFFFYSSVQEQRGKGFSEEQEKTRDLIASVCLARLPSLKPDAPPLRFQRPRCLILKGDFVLAQWSHTL